MKYPKIPYTYCVKDYMPKSKEDKRSSKHVSASK